MSEKISILEKVSRNKKVIIKRTLLTALGIVGGSLLVGFLAKGRFEDDTVEIVEGEDGSFTITEVSEANNE